MKKFLLLGLCVASVFISSCSKDDEDPSNVLKYDGEKITLDKGVIKDYGSWGEGVYNLDIYLCSTGISYDEPTNTFSGTGNYIYFELFTGTDGELTAGTYNLTDTEEAGTFDSGRLKLGVNYSDDSYEEAVDFLDGKVVIEKSGTTYKMTITGHDYLGKAISAYYAGSLIYHEVAK
jgi:hypothetical protein